MLMRRNCCNIWPNLPFSGGQKHSCPVAVDSRTIANAICTVPANVAVEKYSVCVTFRLQAVSLMHHTILKVSEASNPDDRSWPCQRE